MGAMAEGVQLWGGGIVPYEINPDLGNIVAIQSAIRTLEQQTNVRFVARYLQEDYVRFSKQTAGNPNSREGRRGGRQFLNASLNDVSSLVHEMCHTLGMMHEHQRDDRDDYVIFHEDRVMGAAPLDQYEIRDTESRTEKYDFQSVMHYNAGDPGNPIFESVTGVPPPAEIGAVVPSVLTITDKTFLEALYPSAPVIRRSDGEGGAGVVFQTSAIAVPSANNTAILANAIRNASGNYQLVLWRIRENGVVLRMPDPAGATGGGASDVQIVPVGRLFVSAMKNANGELLLISHSNTFERLNDSAGQAGEVRDLHLVALSDRHVLTPCISASGRVLVILWELLPDGSIVRRFDSGSDGPEAKSVSSVVFNTGGATQFVAIVYADQSSKLVLSTWRVDASSIQFVADSKDEMGKGDAGQVINAVPGYLVVVCRDRNRRLLLIPFQVASDGSVSRFSGGEGRAGRVREVAAVVRPYGLLTATISERGHLLLIKWAVKPNGAIGRLGESGTQAGEGSSVSVAGLPFAEQATVGTVVRDGSAKLLPITWDDSDGPGELSV